LRRLLAPPPYRNLLSAQAFFLHTWYVRLHSLRTPPDLSVFFLNSLTTGSFCCLLSSLRPCSHRTSSTYFPTAPPQPYVLSVLHVPSLPRSALSCCHWLVWQELIPPKKRCMSRHLLPRFWRLDQTPLDRPCFGDGPNCHNGLSSRDRPLSQMIEDFWRDQLDTPRIE